MHRGLARARDRHRHLFHGSILALIAAILGWILGLGLEVRALLVVAAAALAWSVPLRGSDEWALAWIGDRAGLAYQTALEMTDEEDPYGLRTAVEARADASLSRVERPEHSAWWLPLMALAVGALLLPALPLGTGGGPLGGPLPPGAGGTPSAVAEDAAEEAEEAEPNLPGDAPSRVARTPEASQANDDRVGPGESQGDGEAGEREALERYLRGLRERPEARSEQETGDQETGGQAPSGAAPRPGQQRSGGEGGERTGENGSESSERTRSGERGDGEGEERGSSASQGGEQQPQNPFAQAGSDGNEGSGEQQQPGQGDGRGDGQPGDQQLEEGGDEQATGPGESTAGSDQQGRGQGAGALPSGEQEAGRAGAAGDEEIQLRGELGHGPTSQGGTIQLPGGDEVELPPGRTPESYAREVESAVTEGRVPLEYQEIIRNYFR